MRADLLQAAMELFAKEGSRGTSLAAIAERIGVTAPAITHHFGTKQALLFEIVEELDRVDPTQDPEVPREPDWADNIRNWARRLAHDPAFAKLSRLRAVIVAEAIDPDFPAHHHFVERHRQLRQTTADALARAQRDGGIRADVDVTTVAAELVAYCQGVQTQWLLDPEGVPLVEIVDAYLDRLRADVTP